MSAHFTLEEVLKATGGKTKNTVATQFQGVGTDTRASLNGKIFFALKGPTFDAHDFLSQAVIAGARALVVDQAGAAVAGDVTVIEVHDTLKALQDLAKFWREKQNFKVVGISGSNGKSTTKEFAFTLIKDFIPCYASHGSFNNHVGVPLSLLAAGPETQIVLQEMGMNHSGELTALSEIARPDVVAVTMVGQSHIGELGSQQAIALAKEELYDSSPQATQIFNIDNAFTIEMYERARKRSQAGKLITFSSFREADVSLRVHRMTLTDMEVAGTIGGTTGQTVIPVVGRQNVVNLMAASSIALAVGVKPQLIWQSLKNCRTIWGRNQLVRLKSGGTVLFDGYNANPESMAALLRNLLEIDGKGKKIAVLGEMLELGHLAPTLHEELGRLAAATDLDVVWFMGPHAADFERGLKLGNFKKSSYLSEGYEHSLALKIASMLDPDGIAVIKGSRGMKLERVLNAWNPLDFANKSVAHDEDNK